LPDYLEIFLSAVETFNSEKLIVSLLLFNLQRPDYTAIVSKEAKSLMNDWKVKVVNKNRFEITIVYNVKRGNRAIMPTEVFNQNFMYIDEQKHWAIKK
jgi:hypothetical protein